MKEYQVMVHGIEHTFLLDDEDAEARGLLKGKTAASTEAKKATPANKSRTVENKA